jgi:hypothetical protein
LPDRTRLLELALKGLEADRAKIDDEIAQIKSELKHQPTAGQTMTAGSATVAAPQKKRKMSAAARRKISEAMKRRSAANKAVSASKAPSPPRTAKSASTKQNRGNRLTAAGRKKLSDLMKKRWAERRKAKTK